MAGLALLWQAAVLVLQGARVRTAPLPPTVGVDSNCLLQLAAEDVARNTSSAVEVAGAALHVAAFDTQLERPTYWLPFNVTMLRPAGQERARFSVTRLKQNGVFQWRVDAYARFVESLPPDDIAVLFDARDVGWGGCADEARARQHVIETFEATRARVVFGAEMGCFPEDAICWRSPDADFPIKQPPPANLSSLVSCDWFCGPTPGYRFLNAGFVVGRARHLVELYARAKQLPRSVCWGTVRGEGCDDQVLLSRAFVEFGREMNYSLDRDAELVLNLHNMQQRSLVPTQADGLAPGAVYTQIFNRVPCFVHGNGDGKVWMGRVFRRNA